MRVGIDAFIRTCTCIRIRAEGLCKHTYVVFLNSCEGLSGGVWRFRRTWPTLEQKSAWHTCDILCWSQHGIVVPWMSLPILLDPSFCSVAGISVTQKAIGCGDTLGSEGGCSYGLWAYSRSCEMSLVSGETFGRKRTHPVYRTARSTSDASHESRYLSDHPRFLVGIMGYPITPPCLPLKANEGGS